MNELDDDPFAPKPKPAANGLTKPRAPVRMVEPAELDRLPPHSLEAEQGVLGCILLSPLECLPHCQTRLKSPAVLYDLRHQNIYKTMLDMLGHNVPVDTISLQQHLKNRKLLDSVGGLAFLSALPDSVPSAANLDYYIDIVLQHYASRRILTACATAVTVINQDETAYQKALSGLERETLAISADSHRSAAIDPIKTLIVRANERIETLHANQGSILGLPTGFIDLDKRINGLEPAELVLLAGRPSTGKTCLGLNIAENVALSGKPVGFFSLEMSADQLAMRMLCSRARVNLRNISDGFLRESDTRALAKASIEISRSPLYIDDTANLTIDDLEARAYLMVQQYGAQLLIVDYIGLIQTAQHYDKRNAQIAAISARLKRMAKRFKLPVVVLCQLDRGLDKQKNQRPRMADLRESGSLEQDADKIIALYNPKSDEDTEDKQTSFLQEALAINALILKQRNGPAGIDVRFTFLKFCTRFELAAKVSMDDIPEANVVPFSPPAEPKESTLPYPD